MTIDDMKARIGPLRPDKVYAAEIYPGGRRTAGQYSPDILLSVDKAIERLKQGHRVYVALDDLVLVVTESGIPV